MLNDELKEIIKNQNAIIKRQDAMLKSKDECLAELGRELRKLIPQIEENSQIIKKRIPFRIIKWIRND